MDDKARRWIRWVGIKSLGRRELSRVMRSGSLMNLRVLLACAAMLYTVLVLVSPVYSWQDPTNVIKDHAPSMELWAAMFALDAFCLWWRILDTKSRIWWAWGINIYTFALWFSLVGVTTSTLDYLSPDSTGEIMFCLIAAWTTFRVDTTDRDKETA